MPNLGMIFKGILVLTVGARGIAPGVDPAEDAQEVALRWAFANAETDLAPPAAHCVAISPDLMARGDDPGPEFLARFAGDPVPVRPASACRFEGNSAHSVVDKATGEIGLLFTVSPARFPAADEGVIRVAYLQGGLWGRGWECIVRKDSGDEWAVAGCRTVVHV